MAEGPEEASLAVRLKTPATASLGSCEMMKEQVDAVDCGAQPPDNQRAEHVTVAVLRKLPRDLNTPEAQRRVRNERRFLMSSQSYTTVGRNSSPALFKS